MSDSAKLIEICKAKALAWTKEPYDEDSRKAVEKMLSEDHDELVEAFYKDLEFGTGGLRGIMGPGSNRVNKYTSLFNST